MRRLRWWIVAVVIAAIGVALSFADVLGIERLPVVAGLLGPRNAALIGCSAVGILLVVGALTIRRGRRVALPLGLALLVAAASNAPTALARGFTDEPPASAATGQLRILSWNINGSLVQPIVVARLAARMHANIVVLPEITPQVNGADYEPAFRSEHMFMHAYPSDADGTVATVVFVADSLGSYLPNVGHSFDPLRSAALTPATAGLPTIVAIHAAQPSLQRNGDWNSGLDWVARLCAKDDVVAVGDFNATVDSFGASLLGRCQDAATLRHESGVGSWPVVVPTYAAMPLDHVLVSPGWRVTSFSVLTSEDHSGSRHRPILAVLTRSP